MFLLYPDQKTNLFYHWLENLCLFIINLVNSAQISILLFLHTLCVWLLLKKQWSAFLISSLIHFFLIWFSEVSNCIKCFLCTWHYYNRHSKDADRIPMLANMGASADHDTQTCCLAPKSYFAWICYFSQVVYCGYTKLGGWLLSLLLSQMWLSTLTRKGSV